MDTTAYLRYGRVSAGQEEKMFGTWWGEVLKWYGYVLAFAAPVIIVGMGLAWLREGNWRWPNW